MEFQVSADKFAYGQAIQISTLHRHDSKGIVAAWNAALRELGNDAHLKGEPVNNLPRMRRIKVGNLRVYFIVDGTRAQIKSVQYSRS